MADKGRQTAVHRGHGRNGEWRLFGHRVRRPMVLSGAVGVITVAGLWFTLSVRVVPPRHEWRVGDLARNTIAAPRSGFFVDDEATQRQRQAAADAVPAQYESHKEEALAATLKLIRSIFVDARAVRRDPGLASDLGKDARLEAILQVVIDSGTRRTMITCSDAELALLQDAAERLAMSAMRNDSRERTEDLNQAKQQVLREAQQLEVPAPLGQAAADLARRAIRENLMYDEKGTLEERERKVAAVQPVQEQIDEGDVIVEAGERITARHLAILEAVGKAEKPLGQEPLAKDLALGTLVVALLVMLAVFVQRSRPDVWRDWRGLALLGAVLVANSAATRTANVSDNFEGIALTSMATLTLIVSGLYDAPLALVTGGIMGLLAGVAAPGSDVRLVLALIGVSAAAAFAISPGASRTRVVINASPVLGILSPGLFLVSSVVFGLAVTPVKLAYAAVGGLLAPALAVGLLQVLERLLSITTDPRLLELSNPEEPLLRRLVIEAPGTYASSIAVANLAETAVEAIGGNALLTRVGCYYHDIGKLRRPFYFIENQQGSNNPHDRLSPHMSARVIIAHVRDGLEMAEEAGLPQEVRDFIAQHHGTTLAEYFYERALQEEQEEEVSEAAFRYTGPRPRTREAAVAMIGDAVEAAARTLVTPDRDALRQLVENIVRRRQADHQFDECNLTFRELTLVKDSLVRTLTAIFHQRIRYPEQLEETGERAPAAALGTAAERRARAASGHAAPGP